MSLINCVNFKSTLVYWLLLLLYTTSHVVEAGGFYSKSSDVINLDASNFAAEVLKTNHSVMVEFYADWCGHCKNMKPAFEKAAASVSGLAKMGAVQCNDEGNQQLCQRYNVKGYPSLKIFSGPAVGTGSQKQGIPPKKSRSIQDYHGARTARAISDGVLESVLPSNIARLGDIKAVRNWLDEDFGRSKVVLLSNKGGATPPVYKALSIDFAGSIDFAIVSKAGKVYKELAQDYNLDPNHSLPALVYFRSPKGTSCSDRCPEIFQGDPKKLHLYNFLADRDIAVEGPRAGETRKPKRDEL